MTEPKNAAASSGVSIDREHEEFGKWKDSRPDLKAGTSSRDWDLAWLAWWNRASAAPAAVVPKDHEIREMVDRVTAIARGFHATEQLRERIAFEVLPFVQSVERIDADKLQREIMKLPLGRTSFALYLDPDLARELYSEGHRDARQAASEMVSAALGGGVEGQKR